jgi:hypothetical protein
LVVFPFHLAFLVCSGCGSRYLLIYSIIDEMFWVLVAK